MAICLSCFRSKGNKPRPGSLNKGGSTSGGSGKHGKGERTEKLEKQLSRHGHRGAIPFHRRSPVADELLLQDIDMVTTQRMANPAFSSASSSTNNFKGATTVAAGSAAAVPSNTSLPQLHNTTATTPAGVSGVGGDQSLDSPHSAAPSPLDASHSAPSLSQNTDPTMPTLSPHPPATKNDGGGGSVVKLENNSASNTKQNESQDASAGGAGAATTTTPGGAAAGDIYTKTPGSVAKSENFTSPYQSNVGDSKMDSVSHWVDSHRPPTEQFGIIKRPTLKKRDYEEGEMAEELPTESLYDFNSLNAW